MFIKDDTVKINVTASQNYTVYIGSGLRKKAGTLIAEVHEPCTAAIITDSNVAPLYLEEAAQSMEDAGFKTLTYVFPAGEASKNISTLSRILEFLAESHLTRTDLVVALGGGVTGDMSGFAAAVYLRGIPYVQMPTTLLSAVDSSVGGKTAVDLDAGKNLVGAFKQPLRVICDIETLNTLPDEVYDDGMAECIKYGMLQSQKMIDIFSSEHPKEQVLDIISEAVQIKAMYVADDEFDTGIRCYLNLGHTIGHAIERCSGYTIMHGHAVAAGMALITHAGEKMGITEPGTSEKLQIILEKNHLPTSTEYSVDDLVYDALSDKKRKGDEITIIVPENLTHCTTRTVPVSELKNIITLALTTDH